jgi:hypothetical protein
VALFHWLQQLDCGEAAEPTQLCLFGEDGIIRGMIDKKFADFQQQLKLDPNAVLVVNINTDRKTIAAARQNGSYVYIGKTSPWGNPFQVGWDGDLQEVVDKYRDWIKTQPTLMAETLSLRGKILGCYCAPRPCHGNVLAELARHSTEARAYQAKSGDSDES